MPENNQPNKINAELQRAIDALFIGERPIAYYSILARVLKSVTAGVLLSQFLYWTPRGKGESGWFYKEQKDIYAETALTRREQETARKVLRKFGVVEEKRIGVPGRIHFRVDTAKLAQLLGDYVAGASSADFEEDQEEGDFSHNGGKRHSTMAETDIAQWRNSATYNGAFAQSNTETTTETTDRDISNIRRASPPKNRREETNPAPQSPGAATSGQPVAIGSIIQQRRRGRPTAAEAEARSVLLSYVADLAREFNDQASLKASTTRAFNLYRQSGLDVGAFVSLMLEARAITKERTAAIRSTVATGRSAFPQKNKMAYYFSVLGDRLGLKDDQGEREEEAPPAPLVQEERPFPFGQLPPRRS